MNKILATTLTLLFSATAFAALSGIDHDKAKEDVRAAYEEADSRLSRAETLYGQIISSAAISAEAYDNYSASLYGAGEAVGRMAGYAHEVSALVSKLEQAEPKPDDMNQLRSFEIYTKERSEAAAARYQAARGNTANIKARIEEQRAAFTQAAGLGNDPKVVEERKRRELKAAAAAKAMGDKQKEFAAINRFTQLDPQNGGQMMNKFFDGLTPQERGAFSVQLNGGTSLASNAASEALLNPTARVSKQLDRPMGAVVPGMNSGDGKEPVKEEVKTPGTSKPLVSATDFKIGLWSAVGQFSPTVAAPHLRETKLQMAADAKTDWLNKKRQDFLDLSAKAKTPAERDGHLKVAGNIEKLISKKEAAGRLDDTEQRSGALADWNNSVSRLMDNSNEGGAEKALVDRKAELDAEYAALKTDKQRAAWIEKNGGEYNETGEKLAGFYVDNPEYLGARKADSEAQVALRANVPFLADGTELTAGELGLDLPAGQKVSISSLKDGARGFAYNDENGLAQFQSFDDTVRVNEFMDANGIKRTAEQRLAADGTLNMAERLPDGSLARTEERRPDGSMTVEVYGPGGKPVASKLTRADGSQVQTLVMAKEGIKRTVFTSAKGAETYEIKSLSGKDGFPKQSGRVIDGQFVMDRIDIDADTAKVRTGDYAYETKAAGKSLGFEVDLASINRLPEGQRAQASMAAASTLAGGDANKAGPLNQFIKQANRQGGPGSQVSVSTVKNDKGETVYLADIVAADGHKKQLLGEWSKLSKAESAGLPSDVGLNFSVRSAGKDEDVNGRQFTKIFRYCGENITDRYTAESRVTGNWFVGYGAEADNYVVRTNSDTRAKIKTIHIGTDELYTSPSILGHTGAAIGTLGRGAVQLTGSAMAVVGAGTVGWADKDLQSEFMQRAKSNFYGNDVSRSLGKSYFGDYYAQGYDDLKVDETRNIQNVGKEMTSMGKPMMGAILQGGVEYSNMAATTIIALPLMGGAGAAVSKTGTIGTKVVAVAGKGYSIYGGAKSVYDTGKSGVEFVQASRAFDENDPASKERYYAAVTDLTARSLNAPKAVSRAFKMTDAARTIKGTITGKGPVVPPENLSDFKKFMLGKNEPGMITKVLNKEITGGLDPKLSFAPITNTVSAANKWASNKLAKMTGSSNEMPKPGLISSEPLKPDGKIITAGQVTPKPDAKIVVPGQVTPNPDAKIVLPKQVTPKPDVKIVLPRQVTPKPDAKIIVPGEVVPNPDAQIILPGG